MYSRLNEEGREYVLMNPVRSCVVKKFKDEVGHDKKDY
jgi:hypothetical protein